MTDILQLGNFFQFFFETEVQLVYNVVLVLSAQKSDSVLYFMYTCTYIYFRFFFIIRNIPPKKYRKEDSDLLVGEIMYDIGKK